MAGAPGDWDWDSAARLITAFGQAMASQARASVPQPFGLPEMQLPKFLGSLRQAVQAQPTDITARPAPLGPITSMMLCYGIPEDPQSEYLEVLTDFTSAHKDSVSLRSAIGQAVGMENDRRAGTSGRPRRRYPAPRGSLRGRLLDIVVAGQARTVHTQAHQNFNGLQFTHSGRAVTVIARGHWPERPAFDLINDLEPYLTALESADSEVIKARIRAIQMARSGPA